LVTVGAKFCATFFPEKASSIHINSDPNSGAGGLIKARCIIFGHHIRGLDFEGFNP
jgi:hypothetical protein